MEPIENTSGMGKQAVLPRGLDRWNWGAFFLNWIWGIGNSTYIALLMFVPFVNLVMIFILGVKGNQWAWQNRAWRDVEHFRKAQRMWGYVGFASWVVVISCIVYIPTSLLKGDAYRLSISQLKTNNGVIRMVGTPIKPGLFVWGNIKVTPTAGVAALSYSISGPRGSAQVYVEATKQAGAWSIHNLVVVSDEDPTNRVIVVGDGRLKTGNSV